MEIINSHMVTPFENDPGGGGGGPCGHQTFWPCHSDCRWDLPCFIDAGICVFDVDLVCVVRCSPVCVIGG